MILLVFCSSCAGNPHWWKPHGRTFSKHAPKDGSDGFRLGWMHGCESGFATQFGGAIYMSLYEWKKDPDLVTKNPDINKLRVKYQDWNVNWNNVDEVNKNLSDYKKIFWRAHIFCRHTVLGTMQMAEMEPPLPNEPRYDPGKHSLGNIYNMRGRGNMRGGLW